MQLEINPTEENRSSLRKAEAELKRYLHMEEDYWKKKAGMRWFQEGDINTKFFHAYVKGRRRKLQILKIKSRQGDDITSTQNIGEEAVHVFKEQFMENNNPTDFSMLDIIPKLVSDEQNEDMGKLPTEDEVK
uniref:Putative ovule protein n=1 Tax=Solanum chacoense TaxID=4108 RepID=A0A0V0HB06_SOLCH